MTEYADLLTQHGINYDEAMERFGGNETLFVRLARKFLDDPHFPALETALAEGDAQEAHRQAHSLKGVAGNLSFDALYHEAAVISDALREGDVETATAHLPIARRAYDQVMSALGQLG